MKTSIANRRGRRSKNTSFNPNKDFVKSATDEFLKNGGKITRVVDLSDSFESFINYKENTNLADEFLLGN